MGRSGMETRAQQSESEGTQAQPATASIHVLRGRGPLARRRDRELECVAFDATHVPDAPPFLWKWQRCTTHADIPSAGEQGCAYWVVDDLRAFVWVGKLQIMPVDVRPPADIGGDEMLNLEDQLDRDERLRAESLGLAIEFVVGQGPIDADKFETVASVASELHKLADEFRNYIEDGLPVVEEDEDEEGDRE